MRHMPSLRSSRGPARPAGAGHGRPGPAPPMGILTFTVVVTGWSLALGRHHPHRLPIVTITIQASRGCRGGAPPRGARARRADPRRLKGVHREVRGRLKALSPDPSTWKDLVGICCCCWSDRRLRGRGDGVVGLLGLILTPAFWWAWPDSETHGSLGLLNVDSWGDALLAMAIGVVLLPVAAALVRGTRPPAARLAVVLGPSRRELEERVERLNETRAGAVDAAAAELQPHRARPARRRAGAARRAGDGPRHGRGALRPRPRGRARARRRGARGGQARARRAARPRPRHPPGAARRARAGRGDRRARRARAAADARVERRRSPAPARRRSSPPPTSSSPRRSTNAAKHARRAARVRVVASSDAARLDVEVRDDGRGGADPRGHGLDGLRKRVAALDGDADVVSPPGGPTVLRAELPCGS